MERPATVGSLAAQTKPLVLMLHSFPGSGAAGHLYPGVPGGGGGAVPLCPGPTEGGGEGPCRGSSSLHRPYLIVNSATLLCIK